MKSTFGGSDWGGKGDGPVEFTAAWSLVSVISGD